MEIQNFLSKFKKSRAVTKEQALADEVSKSLGLRFPLVIKMIHTKGYQFIFEIFKESKEGRNPKALFMWKYGECKMQELKK